MEDEDGTSYYFRGAVENNNVQFENMKVIIMYIEIIIVLIDITKVKRLVKKQEIVLVQP